MMKRMELISFYLAILSVFGRFARGANISLTCMVGAPFVFVLARGSNAFAREAPDFEVACLAISRLGLEFFIRMFPK